MAHVESKFMFKKKRYFQSSFICVKEIVLVNLSKVKEMVVVKLDLIPVYEVGVCLFFFFKYKFWN